MTNLEARVSTLNNQINELSKKRVALSEKMMETPTDSDEFTKMMNTRTDIEDRMKAINEQVVLVKNKIRIAEEDAVKAQGTKEYKRKLNLFNQLKDVLPKCPNCGTQLELTKDIAQPAFDLPIFSTMPTKNTKYANRWWIDVSCPKMFCGFRKHLCPDVEGTIEHKKSPKSLASNLPAVLG